MQAEESAPSKYARCLTLCSDSKLLETVKLGQRFDLSVKNPQIVDYSKRERHARIYLIWKQVLDYIIQP